MYRQKNAKPLKERFWKNVKKTNGCWVWTKGLSSGYGRIQTNKKSQLAHRVSWELHTGKPAGKLQVCHKCDNPKCVRPSHLFLGTMKDNIQDALKKGRMCWGEQHPASKLTKVDAFKIRTLYKRGYKQNKIATMYKINQSNVSRLVRRLAWKGV